MDLIGTSSNELSIITVFVIERPDDHEVERKTESIVSSVEELDVDSEIILVATEGEIAARTE